MQPNDGQNMWQPNEGEVGAEEGSTAVSSSAESTPNDLESISWEASESIHHERDGLWYAGFIAIFSILIGVSVWLAQWTFTILLVIMAIALLVYIKRPPRVVQYNLSDGGLQVGEVYHNFSEFRAFGILKEQGLFSIMLLPTKRFSQALTVYFAEKDGEMIVDILGSHLPMEELRVDIMDNILRRLRL